ncbi:MAG: hypothetical protein WCL11_26995, partial [Verrucomicrobiota bacterium]
AGDSSVYSSFRRILSCTLAQEFDPDQSGAAGLARNKDARAVIPHDTNKRLAREWQTIAAMIAVVRE